MIDGGAVDVMVASRAVNKASREGNSNNNSPEVKILIKDEGYSLGVVGKIRGVQNRFRLRFV
ncbi:hypothetical protein SAMD00023353_1202250 [Rosellinia necatrix]|uniref:Uncharacterized protein n=1 Tax=Rosellinia necatrix TaxID=77044 RepID=A0A1W2TKJ5_ROSNE|nr:hypothetical protein SAMD00023353_1202250 [Rosellinia necatrix]